MAILTQKKAQSIQTKKEAAANTLQAKRLKEIEAFIKEHPLHVAVRLDSARCGSKGYEVYDGVSHQYPEQEGLWLTPEGEFKKVTMRMWEKPRYIRGTSWSGSPGVRSGSVMQEDSEIEMLSLSEAIQMIDWKIFQALKRDVLAEELTIA